MCKVILWKKHSRWEEEDRWFDLAKLKQAKKLMSGVMASNGIHSLCDPRFLQAYNEKRRKASEKLEKNATAK